MAQTQRRGELSALNVLFCLMVAFYHIASVIFAFSKLYSRYSFRVRDCRASLAVTFAIM